MENFILAGAYCAVWSACIWCVVGLFKTAVRVADVPLVTSVWGRVRDLAAMLVGGATGLIVLSFILDLAGVDPELTAASRNALPVVGAFVGIGAGAVSAKVHDAGLHRLEDFIRRGRDV